MTVAQLDAMITREREKAWAELNREDTKAKEAVELCKKAIKAVLEAERLLNNAAEQVESTPEEDRILSIADILDELECAIYIQIERMN